MCEHLPAHREGIPGSRGAEEELLQRLQAHVAHLKPELAIRVAMFLLPAASEVLCAPASMLPQRVSLAIQELAALQKGSQGVSVSAALGSAAETTGMPLQGCSWQGQPGQGQRIVHRRSCRSIRVPLSPATGRDADQLLTSRSTPAPREEYGDDNYTPKQHQGIVHSAMPSSTPEHQHFPRALQIGKRHSEPLHVELDSSRRRVTPDYMASLSRLASPSGPKLPVQLEHQEDAAVIRPAAQHHQQRQGTLTNHKRHASAAHVQIREAAAVLPLALAGPAPQRSTYPGCSGADSDSTSEDNEDVAKAVVRVLKSQLSSTPALAEALAKLMLHDGICSKQELLKVAAGGRSAGVDAVAAAAVNRALEHQVWIEDLPSDSPPVPVRTQQPDLFEAAGMHFAQAVRITRSQSVDTACSTPAPHGNSAVLHWPVNAVAQAGQDNCRGLQPVGMCKLGLGASNMQCDTPKSHAGLPYLPNC